MTRAGRDLGRTTMIFACSMVAAIVLSPWIAAQARATPIDNGQRLYEQRCAMCHGVDASGSGPLAHSSHPPAVDLTTKAFRKRLVDYPGIIVADIILRPHGDLIPRTLRENGYTLPRHAWTVQDFRDLDAYVKRRIHVATR